MLLTRHPWLVIAWQERIAFPELVEGNIIKINKNSTKIQALWTLRGFLPSKFGAQGPSLENILF